MEVLIPGPMEMEVLREVEEIVVEGTGRLEDGNIVGFERLIDGLGLEETGIVRDVAVEKLGGLVGSPEDRVKGSVEEEREILVVAIVKIEESHVSSTPFASKQS